MLTTPLELWRLRDAIAGVPVRLTTSQTGASSSSSVAETRSLEEVEAIDTHYLLYEVNI